MYFDIQVFIQRYISTSSTVLIKWSIMLKYIIYKLNIAKYITGNTANAIVTVNNKFEYKNNL